MGTTAVPRFFVETVQVWHYTSILQNHDNTHICTLQICIVGYDMENVVSQTCFAYLTRSNSSAIARSSARRHDSGDKLLCEDNASIRLCKHSLNP